MKKLAIEHVVALQCLIDGNIALPADQHKAVVAARDAHVGDYCMEQYDDFEEGRMTCLKPLPSEIRAARSLAKLLNDRSVTFEGDLM